MTRKFAIKPLGTVLQQAGLVSAAQIEMALREQAQSRHLRLGEILALHGWIKLETADFFVLEWPVSLKRPRQPLGRYLKQAALLNEVQIQIILSEQKQAGQKFGEMAVSKGWLANATRNFFVQFQASLPKQDLTPERLISSWRSASSSHGLRMIRDRLLNNQQCNPFWLLEQYRQILKQGSIAVDWSPEQQELLKSGLVVQRQDRLKIAKPIYASVFDLGWVEREQNRLQPYRKIKLRLEEKVESPYKVLEEILLWTNRQPWLAQKLCQLVCQTQQFIAAGEEARRVEQLVQTFVIDNWQKGAAAEHLLAIRDRLLKDSSCPPTALLSRYLQICQQGKIPVDGSLEQSKLLSLGLVVEQQNSLKIANPIYHSVFDRSWVMQEMAALLPAKEVPLMANASQQHATIAAKKLTKKNKRVRRTVWELIFAVVAGVSAAVGFYFQQQRSAPPVSTPDSPAQTAQPSSESTFPPVSEAFPESPEASEPPPGDVSTDSESPQTPPESTSAPPDPPPADVSTDSESPQTQSSTASDLPTFSVGTTEEELLQALGEPDSKQEGYWPNSRAWLYKDIVPNQVDLGYLFDTNTQKLRQTEVSFAQSVDLETIQETLNALLGENVSDSAQTGLTQIYRREANLHAFEVGTLEGIIQRNENDQIYIGIWDANFH